MENPIATAYVQDFDGELWSIELSPQDDCSIEEHIQFIVDGMFSDDELINIVIH